jgi:hypothetical protein
MLDINPQAERQKVFDYARTMLGDGMIDIELDPIHYETGLSKALNKFRQRSSHAVEESYMFLELRKETNDYKLPDEVIEVRSIFRRTLGSRSGGGTGTNFEPFNLAYTNTYLLNSTMLGGLATYELFAGYQEMVGKMFGSYIEFQWVPHSHVLRILQRVFAEGETVMLRTYNYKPDYVLINDVYAGQWIKDYTLSTCKLILAQAREKFASIAGPQGGTALNGGALKSEATAELEKLEKELDTQVSGGVGYTFIIG